MGRLELIIWILIPFVILITITNFYEAGETTVTCESELLKIKTINGISDMDTGFMSGGTTNQKNIMFSNNQLVTFEDRRVEGVKLIIGATYNLSVCHTVNGGSIGYSYTETTLTQVSDAFVGVNEHE